ncbi:transporter substrate-binding domain-containing protein [bacterium]|nr:transporter substrate-binding domain-containing protein [bacterium]
MDCLKLKRTVSALVLLLFFIPFTPLLAAELKVSLAKMPVYAESNEKGVLVDLSKLISKELNMDLNLTVVPFARSISNAVTRKVDFHMPLIQSPGYRNEVSDFDYSTETIFHVNFVLYENKTKPLNLEQMNTYNIETDRAHTNYFPFETIASSCLECSLKKVDIGRIDGFIFADFASDPIIRKDNLINLKRRLYKVFDVKIVLPKGEQGGRIDMLLSKAIGSLKAKGEYQKLMDKFDMPYDDWQP